MNTRLFPSGQQERRGRTIRRPKVHPGSSSPLAIDVEDHPERGSASQPHCQVTFASPRRLELRSEQRPTVTCISLLPSMPTRSITAAGHLLLPLGIRLGRSMET